MKRKLLEVSSKQTVALSALYTNSVCRDLRFSKTVVIKLSVF
jgi:hypothetical protein